MRMVPVGLELPDLWPSTQLTSDSNQSSEVDFSNNSESNKQLKNVENYKQIMVI